MSVLSKLFSPSYSPISKHLLTCAPSPPPAPDYAGAAKAQGDANVDAAKIQGKLNNPNVISPYGQQTIMYGQPIVDPQHGFVPGDPNQATITQTFSPGQQAIFDAGNRTKLSLTNLAERGAGVAGDVVGKNLDLSSLPSRPGSSEDTRNKVIDAMMSRVNEDTDRKNQLTQSNLVASGIPSDSKAYQDAFALNERVRTDAANQAYLAGGQEAQRDFNMDSQLRREALAEYLTQRQTPINEITALMSGSQISNPFSMPGYAQNSSVAAAPVFGAMQAGANYNTDLYNAQAAQAGNLQSGLFGLGSAGIGAGGLALMGSDRRWKSNIQRVSTHPLGIGWYEYDIGGRREHGVMADELMQVKPSAVYQRRDGFLMVDYSQIGGRNVPDA